MDGSSEVLRSRLSAKAPQEGVFCVRLPGRSASIGSICIRPFPKKTGWAEWTVLLECRVWVGCHKGARRERGGQSQGLGVKGSPATPPTVQCHVSHCFLPTSLPIHKIGFLSF